MSNTITIEVSTVITHFARAAFIEIDSLNSYQLIWNKLALYLVTTFVSRNNSWRLRDWNDLEILFVPAESLKARCQEVIIEQAKFRIASHRSKHEVIIDHPYCSNEIISHFLSSFPLAYGYRVGEGRRVLTDRLFADDKRLISMFNGIRGHIAYDDVIPYHCGDNFYDADNLSENRSPDLEKDTVPTHLLSEADLDEEGRPVMNFMSLLEFHDELKELQPITDDSVSEFAEKHKAPLYITTKGLIVDQYSYSKQHLREWFYYDPYTIERASLIHQYTPLPKFEFGQIHLIEGGKSWLYHKHDHFYSMNPLNYFNPEMSVSAHNWWFFLPPDYW